MQLLKQAPIRILFSSEKSVECKALKSFYTHHPFPLRPPVEVRFVLLFTGHFIHPYAGFLRKSFAKDDRQAFRALHGLSSRATNRAARASGGRYALYPPPVPFRPFRRRVASSMATTARSASPEETATSWWTPKRAHLEHACTGPISRIGTASDACWQRAWDGSSPG
jgi:hypothetical protein